MEPRDHVFPERTFKDTCSQNSCWEKILSTDYYSLLQVSYSLSKGASGSLAHLEKFILTGKREACSTVSLFWDICSVAGVYSLWGELSSYTAPGKEPLPVHVVRKWRVWIYKRTSSQHPISNLASFQKPFLDVGWVCSPHLLFPPSFSLMPQIFLI